MYFKVNLPQDIHMFLNIWTDVDVQRNPEIDYGLDFEKLVECNRTHQLDTGQMLLW